MNISFLKSQLTGLNLLVLVVAAFSVGLTLPGQSAAEELNPAHVPSDAKWVIHIDFDAMNESELAKHVREEKSQMVQAARRWIQNACGIDVREDLHGVTMFSDSYESHSGAVIMHANIDQTKALAKLNEIGQVAKTSWQDKTLYVVTIDKSKMMAHHRAHHMRGQQTGADTGQQRTETSDRRKLGDADRTYTMSPGSPKKMTFAFLDGQIVVSPNNERVKSVGSLLAGNGSSLKNKPSPLIENMPSGLLGYGAAIGLNQVNRTDHIFPILRQNKRIVWSFGEKDGEMFEDFVMHAVSSEAAGKMKKALDGYVAMLDLWTGESKALKKLVNDVDVSINGSIVKAHWQSDTATTMEAMDAVCERFQSVRK